MSEPASAGPGGGGEVVVTSGSTWSADRRGVAALLYEGYARKAVALRVDRETALALLAGALRPDRCLVAVREGSVVGVIGLVEGNARALEFSFALLRGHFNLLRSVAYLLLLRLRARPANGELLFEALAVLPSARRQGIATSLIGGGETYARDRGCRSVGLDVTDTNRTAIRLYLRLGYTIVATRRFSLLSGVLGFGGSHRMRKHLQDAGCRDRARH